MTSAPTRSSDNTPPPPGSDEALALGCRCPVLDNGHGKGMLGLGMYILAAGCPVHPIVTDEEPDGEA